MTAQAETGALAPVAQRSDDLGVGASADSDVLPATGVAVTSSGGTGPVQEAFDDPRISAYRLTTETIMEEAAILQIIDRTCSDHADAKRVHAAPTAVCPILPDHSVSSWTNAGMPVAR